MMTFENALTANYTVTPTGSAIVHEHADLGNWNAPGPMGPQPSNRILQTDQGAHVHVRYNVSGLLAQSLGGSWKVDVLLEQYGQGEASPGTFSTTLPAVLSVNHNYDAVVTIPPNTLAPGVYDTMIMTTLYDVSNNPLPVTGYEKLGPLQIYQG